MNLENIIEKLDPAPPRDDTKNPRDDTKNPVDDTKNPVIALIGNPNCGKTALFNAVTGGRQKVANYPGVTVEQKSGSLTTKTGHKILLLDLPGTYSLRARSLDEEITRDVALGKFPGKTQPNAFLCVADATNLHLGLRLVLELKKIGKPMILALNMMDIAQRRGYHIDIAKLSHALGVTVIPTVATAKGGVDALVTSLNSIFSDQTFLKKQIKPQSSWSEPTALDVRAYHKEIENILKISNQTQGNASLWTERLDKFLLHPVYGFFTLFFVLFAMFQAVFSWATIPQDWIQTFIFFLQNSIIKLMPDGVLRSLFIDGVLAGVGSVLVFVPQILALFFFILILEDSGYMARAAFLMDKLMGSVGLNGKAFIPLLSSYACAIPGIMATRTIEHKTDRLITILIAPLMTCSARLPVYTLIISAFIPSQKLFGIFNLQGIVLFTLYALGIFGALLVAWIFKFLLHSNHKSFLLFELPCYKIPKPRDILLGLYGRIKIFLKRAGTIILALMIIIWFLCSYPSYTSINPVDPAIEHSFAGILGKWIAPLLAPIGFNWQIAIALIAGFAAREVAIATLGTIYALSGSNDMLISSLSHTLTQAWPLPTALAFLIWYVFAPQCAATLGVTKRETNSWLWPMVMFVYMLIFAYVFAWLTFHISSYLPPRK